METAAISKAPDTLTIVDGREECCEKKTGPERPLFDLDLTGGWL